MLGRGRHGRCKFLYCNNTDCSPCPESTRSATLRLEAMTDADADGRATRLHFHVFQAHRDDRARAPPPSPGTAPGRICHASSSCYIRKGQCPQDEWSISVTRPPSPVTIVINGSNGSNSVFPSRKVGRLDGISPRSFYSVTATFGSCPRALPFCLENRLLIVWKPCFFV